MGPILLAIEVGCGEFKQCDIMNGANRMESFLRMNPFHTVPTLEDGTYYIGESQSMLRYLARKYKPELYPSDAKLAARVDWAMDAWGTTLYTAFCDIAYPILGFSGPPADQRKAIEKMKEVLDMFCVTFMHKEKKYICGDTITIADYKALPFLFVLNHRVLEMKSGVKLSARLKRYVEEMLSSIGASAMLTNPDPGSFSLQSYLEGKKGVGQNFSGMLTECGLGSCGDAKVGPAQAGERSAKVWGIAVSPNALSVSMLAKDTGVGNMELCNLMTGDHLKPAFLEKNPFHQVPTFEGSDGFCLGESNAALRYIATHYAQELYPDNIEERGRIDWAMDAIATGIYKKMGPDVFYPVFGFAAPPADQAAANEACTTILAEFEATFLQGKFVCGNKVSIAEYKFVPFLYSVSQPAVEKKTGFRLSARMQTYLNDAIGALKSAREFLEGGQTNVKGYARSKDQDSLHLPGELGIAAER